MAQSAGAAQMKTRNACERCHDAKVKCDRNKPSCQRCSRKGLDCVYLSHGAKSEYQEPSEVLSALGANFMASLRQLDEQDRKVWSVFFALFKRFKHGYSACLFNRNLIKMMHFLEERAKTGSQEALDRFRNWTHSLKIEIPANTNRGLDHECVDLFDAELDSSMEAPTFNATMEELKQECARKKLPLMTVSASGKLNINAQFTHEFQIERQSMQTVLSASGSFLPWAGDALAQLVVRECDLCMYIQSVAMCFDAIGPPTAYPGVRTIPSMQVLRLKQQGTNALYAVKSVHTEVAAHGELCISSMFVFDKLTLGESPLPLPALLSPSSLMRRVFEHSSHKLTAVSEAAAASKRHQVDSIAADEEDEESSSASHEDRAMDGTGSDENATSDDSDDKGEADDNEWINRLFKLVDDE